MEQYQNFLFITFMLQYRQRQYQARCRGCREILIPDYKKPSYIKGVIELDGKYIPVIDPRIWFLGEPTTLTASACILVVEHNHEYQKRCTGIIVPDFQEVMNLITGCYRPNSNYEPSFNTRFILEARCNTNVSEPLNSCHEDLFLCESEKQSDADYATFKEIVSAELAYV